MATEFVPDEVRDAAVSVLAALPENKVSRLTPSSEDENCSNASVFALDMLRLQLKEPKVGFI